MSNIKFFQNITPEAVQFVNASGTNTGKVGKSGDNLTITNAVGDVLFGDGLSDVYIGNGISSVDLLFEQSGAISAASGSSITLTIGSADTTLALYAPTITNTSTQASESTALMINGSNVVGTRELGTGAFGPTPVGAYLPLIGGTMANTNLVTNMNADLLDGQQGSYYVNTGTTQTIGGTKTFSSAINAPGGNSTEWNTAYDNSITTLAVSGTTTKTLTATQQDGGTLTTSWTDNNTGGTVTSIATGNGLTGGTITSTGTLTMSGSYSGNYTNNGNLTVSNLLTVNGDGHLFLGATTKTPKIDMMYDDHASGPGWDTRIFTGKTDDLPNGQSIPTSTSAGGYGTQYQANSDGAFFGIIPYPNAASANYRPVINWGDDVTDTPFSFQFNGVDKATVSSAGVITAPTFVGALTGNATTATTLQTARTIAGVSFNGSANIALNNNAITNGAGYITSYVNTTYSAGSGLSLTGTVFANTAPNIVQTTVTGNAGSATVLQTARTINGVSFNGSANITVADATKLPLSGGTMSGTLTMNGQTLSMVNGSITAINTLTFNDPGVNEGIKWDGGNLWQIYESPDNQTNAAGNLQFVQNTTRRMTIDTSGNLSSNGIYQSNASLRAPIFYDSNDTGYYLNPASQSHVSTIDFSGSVTGSGAGALIGRNHAYDTLELRGYGSEMMIGSQGTQLHINYRTCNSGAASNTPTDWFWRAGSSSSYSNHYMGDIHAATSSRAPIFYDSNNTSYYLTPDSGSNLWALTVNEGDLKMYENGTYSSELTFQNNTHKLGIDYQNDETLRFITRSGSTTVPITFQMRAGTITASNFILSSDERKKTKIKDLSCDNIDISWKSFEMKSDEGEYRVGVIAQELEIKHPEFVNTDSEGFKSVKYIDLLIAKIAELEARLEKAGL